MQGKERRGGGRKHTSAVEPQTQVYSRRIDVIPPEQLQALLDLGEIRMRQRNRANVGIVAVPCTVEVVGHNIEPVHRRIDLDDIEMLHVPVR